MAKLAALVVAVTTVLTATSMPSSASAIAGPSTDQATVEYRAFSVSIDTFMSLRASRSPSHLDWATDGCSTPLPVGLGDTGRSFDFTKACIHHDFGYRNFPLLDRRFNCPSRPADGYCAAGTWSYGRYWSETARKRIDDRFLADMKVDCAPRPWYQKSTCLAWAQTYYSAVRVGG